MTETPRPPVQPVPPLPVPPIPTAPLPAGKQPLPAPPPPPAAQATPRAAAPPPAVQATPRAAAPPPAVQATPRAAAPPPAAQATPRAAAPPPAVQATPRAAAPPPPPSNPGRAPGMPSLEELIRLAYDEGYSDVHLGVGEQPRMRDRGQMIILDYPEVDYNTFMSWLREILKEDEILKFKRELEFDGATQYEFARVRINVFDTLRGHALVLRLIPIKILTMEQLRLPIIFRDVSDAHKGLILVTGPTGSGKSTTMAAMVDYINKEHPKHIISIEDPVEFVHQSRRSLIKQREVGQNTHKFDNALKAALREDPDIILVGEMRDKETVNTALKAAQTGHLVMGTLHTNSAIKTIERILTLYTAEEQDAMRVAIAESLVAIIAQGLCRTTDGKRAAFHDILINTETVKDYIRQGKNDEIAELMKNGEYDGMITTNQSLFNLYQEGRITEETAMEMSPVPNELAMMLRGRV
ncbi:PilT/PilU family type 4a pilus ATPase [Gloeothece verrucosa]|uniref:Twitching motility protein n=1 Tax=Gloeothece verrucosa (strain PCC 7822) TaxID=497965 RepID=E0UF46_GLOV7|nr:type IV pilus twitching motility protein PilT [Gloeothece verrucosa]ADN14298.1 twitching motility protein [Gloeothece verrucosa PCC 7822]